jgi:hypothetical protein
MSLSDGRKGVVYGQAGERSSPWYIAWNLTACI